MVNKPKARGTSYETSVKKYLIEQGWIYTKRRTLSGANDKGDLELGDGIPVTIECKNVRSHSLSQWISELLVEIKNAKAETGAVWFKRAGKGSPADHYVLMTGELYVKLLKAAKYDRPSR